MDRKAAKQLEARVLNESDCSRIEQGKTNGRICLHLVHDLGSETIYDAAEWTYHRWNRNKAKVRSE